MSKQPAQQISGIYHRKVGDIVVTALSDVWTRLTRRRAVPAQPRFPTLAPPQGGVFAVGPAASVRPFVPERKNTTG